MTVDLYTKTMLTIIAACLLWGCAADWLQVPAASAGPSGNQEAVQAGVQLVQVVDAWQHKYIEPIPVRIVDKK